MELRRLRQLEEENAQLKRTWRTWRWTNRCCRTCYKESFEVAAASAAGEHAARGVIASQSDALVRPYKSILWKFCENKKADEYMFVNPNSKKPYTDVKRAFGTSCELAELRNLDGMI